MPSCMNTIKMMKEHRNSFKIDRGSNGKYRKAAKNGVKESIDTPHLRLESGKSDVLSLSFRKEMEEIEQQTSDEKWDNIFEIFKKYMRKIKRKEYNEAYDQVKI